MFSVVTDDLHKWLRGYWTRPGGGTEGGRKRRSLLFF